MECHWELTVRLSKILIRVFAMSWWKSFTIHRKTSKLDMSRVRYIILHIFKIYQKNKSKCDHSCICSVTLKIILNNHSNKQKKDWLLFCCTSKQKNLYSQNPKSQQTCNTAGILIKCTIYESILMSNFGQKLQITTKL